MVPLQRKKNNECSNGRDDDIICGHGIHVAHARWEHGLQLHHFSQQRWQRDPSVEMFALHNKLFTDNSTPDVCVDMVASDHRILSSHSYFLVLSNLDVVTVLMPLCMCTPFVGVVSPWSLAQK